MKPIAFRLIPLLPLLFGSALADVVADFGAQTATPDSVLSKQLNLPEGTGYVVTEVRPDSPAAKLGLTKDDLVLSLDGKPVSNVVSLSELIAATRAPQNEVEVTWSHAGQQSTAKVNLGAGCERADFTARHQKKPAVDKFAGFGGMSDINDLLSQAGNLDEALKQLKEKLESGGGLGGLGSGTSVTSSVTMIDGDHKITSSAGESGKTKIKVTRASDDQVVYEGEIAATEIDKVPEEVREKVRSLVAGGGISEMIRKAVASSSCTDGQAAQQPEHDVSDLLKKLDGDKDKSGK